MNKCDYLIKNNGCDIRNKDFNFKEFKDILNGSDIAGLDYLYENEIKYYNRLYVSENYLYCLYTATCSLNCCVELYENEYENNLENFDYELYTSVRNKLFTEYGFDIEKLYS